MSQKPSLLPFILVVSIPILAFLVGTALLVIFSLMVWSTVQTDDFLSRLSGPMAESVANYRRMRIRGEATQLVAMLNSIEISPASIPNAQAESYLIKLMDISGQNFGTNFKGTEKKHTWTRPNTYEDWAKIIDQVNLWSDENFGTSFYAPHMPMPGEHFEPDDLHPEVQPDFSEPEPTYELPEERDHHSYTPPPQYDNYEPPSNYDNDQGGVIDPGYDENDSYRPDE